MTLTIQRSHISDHSIEKVYGVVADVESYQDFIPWCQKSEIVSTDSSNFFQADLKVGLGPLSETYRSHVTCTPHSKIHVLCKEKPLKYLESTWTFEDLPNNKTKIQYDMHLALQSSFFQGMIKRVLQESADQIFKAFDQRLNSL
tara:strand:- start:5299 stop:5730 length:432 start_codon:yes stop_codon:yes gene_type:complete